MFKPAATVLIIEDDRSIRETLVELIEGDGYAVRFAEHGEAALRILAEGATVDLILLDLSMPIMNGHHFLVAISERFPQLAGIPILIMTAAGRHEVPSYPAERVLRKPLDVDILLERIRHCLNES